MVEKVRFTPSEIRERWSSSLKASTEKIRQGVMKVEEAPSARAIKAKDVMLANLTEAIRTGRWERQLSKVTLEDYKRLMMEVGVNRIPSGVDANAGKFEDFASKLIPAVNAALAEVNKIKPVTLDDSIRRMETFVRKMAQFSYK